ncbi:DNA primase [Alteromonas sp. a30]|uniref:DNA primase n=1 Tax=Alteromonas sp. a30 TaxID=2730917 RepID=UPI00227F1A6F|nr:DNA primase [Alteromonas sp. a30]MCY7296068.1 DNA primase [Alteromonas sp. a30]
MSGRIPRSFIDDLLARTDIVELIDGFVPLKRAGKNHQACCPFHSEKSPSFTVSQEKQFYHCFGCGAHGNAISFLMEYERLEFPEAVEELARYHHVEVPREQTAFSNAKPYIPANKLEDDFNLMEKVSRYFEKQLKDNTQSAKAIDYLKSRGLSGEIVKAYNIGYAPAQWDAILNAFGQSQPVQQQLLDLKLITENSQHKRYDFFRDRIMFPIRDKRGRVIGFGGRVMGDDTPKYLNSPETRIFHKGSELYGFYQARQQHRKLQRVLVVEGYMDVVALAQFGITYAVAALGTATTPEHIQMLLRSTPEIVCCYDGDRAGREAAWRAMNNALPHLKDGTQMRFLFLPDGEDPDTMVRKIGKEAFEDLLQDKAVPLSKFLFDNLLQRHSVATTEGKASLKAEAEPLISQIPGEYQQQMLMEVLSKHTGEYEKHRAQVAAKESNNQSQIAKVGYSRPNKPSFSPGRMMLRLLLDNPKLASECKDVTPEATQQLRVGNLDMLIDMMRLCIHSPHYSTAQVLEHYRDHPNYKALGKLLSWEHAVSDETMATVYRDSFNRLINQHLQGRMEELLSKARQGNITNDEKKELMLLSKANQ